LNTIDALVDDELWNVVGPLLPPEPLKPKGGRPRVPLGQSSPISNMC
jgi:hypothetical protein